LEEEVLQVWEQSFVVRTGLCFIKLPP
jgi:hypothetical protein